ncbi:unnamed protein product [Larinioides sclopetarius]|uniref:Uncharacterized protein n=1 Tax=Larinioides sclopetarius TaxID=280406 RepID=A0AAV2AD61_9ARAC
MILALVLFSIALAIQPSFSHPLGIFADSAEGFDISTDFDAYTGPWNYGNRWWGGNGRLFGGSRGLWPTDGYVENVDYDYGYNYGNPLRTVDVGRDRVVRDVAVTETDNWVRDQTTYRAQPRIRYSYNTVPVRRVYSSGIGGPRTSSLRTGGDLLYLRR